MSLLLSADDRMQIHEIVARFSWALDTGDVEGFLGCFCEDGALVWDAFETPERWQGTAQLRQFATFLRDQPGAAGRQHFVSNLTVYPDGQVVRARAYCAVALRNTPAPHELTVLGYYEDEFVQVQGTWRLKLRTIRDWAGPVLHRIAGQNGERVTRPRPPAITAMVRARDAT